MPEVAELSHVGLFVTDLERSKKFYTEVIGLSVTDEDPNMGLVFLSSRPDVEHHELLIADGRNTPSDSKEVQQISFRCDTLKDVLEYHKRFLAEKVPIVFTITHGNAISCYFQDPDENVAEVFWPTGIDVRQPFAEQVDLTQPEDQILAHVREIVDAAAAKDAKTPSTA
jgi:catechol 2,3-dioxygenase-like lactoylglutathione lyase family enzyme